MALPINEASTTITMFRMVVAQARALIRQRSEIERIANALSANRNYQLLRMIPGIGPISHHRQFLKFCGLDLATCQSGMFRGRTKLSKYDSARLRRTFWMAALRQCRSGSLGLRARDLRELAGQVFYSAHSELISRSDRSARPIPS